MWKLCEVAVYKLGQVSTGLVMSSRVQVQLSVSVIYVHKHWFKSTSLFEKENLLGYKQVIGTGKVFGKLISYLIVMYSYLLDRVYNTVLKNKKAPFDWLTHL